MAKLDTKMIYLTWACPHCKCINNTLIADVGFGFELDLDVTKDGNCKPWLEIDCCMCNFHGETDLSKEG